MVEGLTEEQNAQLQQTLCDLTNELSLIGVITIVVMPHPSGRGVTIGSAAHLHGEVDAQYLLRCAAMSLTARADKMVAEGAPRSDNPRIRLDA